jgi:hypothetical protein
MPSGLGKALVNRSLVDVGSPAAWAGNLFVLLPALNERVTSQVLVVVHEPVVLNQGLPAMANGAKSPWPASVGNNPRYG